MLGFPHSFRLPIRGQAVKRDNIRQDNKDKPQLIELCYWGKRARRDFCIFFLRNEDFL